MALKLDGLIEYRLRGSIYCWIYTLKLQGALLATETHTSIPELEIDIAFERVGASVLAGNQSNFLHTLWSCNLSQQDFQDRFQQVEYNHNQHGRLS